MPSDPRIPADDDPCQFGKYRDTGTTYKEVPASYFMWVASQEWYNRDSPIGRYIEYNRAVLESEIDDDDC